MKSNSIKKVHEEIEQFKLELEKQILYKKKIEVEEKEFKYNNSFYKHQQIEEENFIFAKDIAILKQKNLSFIKENTKLSKQRNSLNNQLTDVMLNELLGKIRNLEKE